MEMIEATHRVVIKSKGMNICKGPRTLSALSIVLLFSTIYFNDDYYYFVRCDAWSCGNHLATRKGKAWDQDQLTMHERGDMWKGF